MNDQIRLVNSIIDAANQLKSSISQDSSSEKKQKLEKLRERENKWHDMSISQLSFYNNLLIVLGTGFLGFAFKDSKFYFTISHATLSPTTTFLSLSLMTSSVFVGLLCGFNRLLDFRHTHRTNVLRRKLCEKNFVQYGEATDHYKIKYSIVYWFHKPSFYNVTDNDYANNPDDVKKKIHTMSLLLKQLGRLTRGLLKTQIILFLLAITSFAISFAG